MTHEIYEALKKRISIADEKQEHEYRWEYPETTSDAIIYFFDAKGMNESMDDDFMFNLVHGMTSTNMWNVAQRFYWLLQQEGHFRLDQRLLEK